MNSHKVASLFRYDHLPDHLQKVSKKFHDLAMDLVDDMNPSPEITLAIRALWDAKNLAVFAAVEAQD